MSVAAAVAAACEQFEFDEETGFHRLADLELPCLHCALSAHRDSRLVCVVDETPSRCILCKKDHKKCTAIPPELKPVMQAYWNALHTEFTADRMPTRLQKWRVMESIREAASALRSLVAALMNPCRTTSRNRIGVAPVLQAQELASNRELSTLLYRVQAGPEYHDKATVEENIRRIVPAYARECPEAEAFIAALERLPTAFETPVDGENDRKKAKFPPTELPDEFIDDMDRLVAEGNPAARNAVRTIGQGPARRGAAQATPQKRRREIEEPEDSPPPESDHESQAEDEIRVSEPPGNSSSAPESSQLRRGTRKRRQATR